MSANVPSDGNGREGHTFGLRGPGETDHVQRQKEPLWGALALVGLVAVFLLTLGAAITVTKSWGSPESSILEHPVALFVSHQKGWGTGGGIIADRGGDLSDQRSIQQRMELVLRLLRGEPTEALASEAHVPVRDLENWERQFVAAGQQGLQGTTANTPQDSLRTVFH